MNNDNRMTVSDIILNDSFSQLSYTYSISLPVIKCCSIWWMLQTQNRCLRQSIICYRDNNPRLQYAYTRYFYI